MLISLLVVLLLSIPLALSFSQMVRVHRFTREMEKMEYKGLQIKDVQVQTLNPLRIGVKLVTEEPLNTDQLDAFKLDVEKHLERDVELEVVLALER